MMNTPFVPHDQEQRDRITSSLDETLFVEAGAGTGKTEALVSRIVALITTGRATISNIAAITFTELAAAELRERVRSRLLSRMESTGSPDTPKEACAGPLSADLIQPLYRPSTVLPASSFENGLWISDSRHLLKWLSLSKRTSISSAVGRLGSMKPWMPAARHMR